MTERICVSVSELRKRYNDKTMTLEKWLNNSENVYVGRRGRIWITENETKRIFHYPGSVWRNDYTVKEHGLEDCLELYRGEILNKLNDEELNIEELRNKKLGCFCKPSEKCHVDILIELLKNFKLNDSGSLRFSYDKTFDDFENQPNFKIKCVKSVTFNISRYGEFTKTIAFKEKQTQKDAIEQVEKYLSEPITESYLKKFNTALFNEENFKIKGELLGECKFLEDLEQKGNHLTIICGS